MNLILLTTAANPKKRARANKTNKTNETNEMNEMKKIENYLLRENF